MNTGTAPKDRLFQTAARLFFRHGYRAVGVDTIAAESGVGKMTLYRHFPSKEDLILAFLRDSDDEFWRYFEASTSAATTARDKLLAFFEALQAYVTSPACLGCPFNNVVAEFPEPNDPGHRIAIEHKQAVRARFEELASATGAPEPVAIANALLMLMDGAYTAARMYGASANNPAVGLADVARRVIDGLTVGRSGGGSRAGQIEPVGARRAPRQPTARNS